MTFAAKQRTFAEAVKVAVFARDADGKKHPHQWRLRHTTLRHTWRRVRRRLKQLKSARGFHELFLIIEQCATHGFGPLAVYDTAHRIGDWLDIEPDRVYLHQGTREGARILTLNYRAPWLMMNEFPRELHDYVRLPSRISYACENGSSSNCVNVVASRDHRQMGLQLVIAGAGLDVTLFGTAYEQLPDPSDFLG